MKLTCLPLSDPPEPALELDVAAAPELVPAAALEFEAELVFELEPHPAAMVAIAAANNMGRVGRTRCVVMGVSFPLGEDADASVVYANCDLRRRRSR
jgi:hypothetical protein